MVSELTHLPVGALVAQRIDGGMWKDAKGTVWEGGGEYTSVSCQEVANHLPFLLPLSKQLVNTSWENGGKQRWFKVVHVQ